MSISSRSASGSKSSASARVRASARPLSPFLYIARNKGKTLPIGLIILLSVALVAGIITLLDSIGLTVRTVYGYNRYFAAVQARGAAELDPNLRRVIRQAPELGAIYEARPAIMQVRTVVGNLPYPVFGLKPGEMEAMVSRVHLRLGEGRLPRPGQPEVALSEPILRNLKVKIGDNVLAPDKPDSYSPTPVKLVGILKGEEWFAVAPYDFIRANFFLMPSNLFVLASDPARQPVLDAYLAENLKSTQSRVWIYKQVETEVDNAFKTLNLIVNICIGILVLVITLMMGLLANIYFTQRMVEFGLLQAIGYTRRSLLGRVTVETSVMVFLGWLAGMALAYAGLTLAYDAYLFPRGLILDPADQRAYLSTAPIPVTICLFAFFTTLYRLRKFDPVAIVERRLV